MMPTVTHHFGYSDRLHAFTPSCLKIEGRVHRKRLEHQTMLLSLQTAKDALKYEIWGTREREREIERQNNDKLNSTFSPKWTFLVSYVKHYYSMNGDILTYTACTHVQIGHNDLKVFSKFTSATPTIGFQGDLSSTICICDVVSTIWSFRIFSKISSYHVILPYK